MRILRYTLPDEDGILFGAVDEDGRVLRIEGGLDAFRITDRPDAPERVLVPVDPVQVVSVDWLPGREEPSIAYRGLSSVQATGRGIRLPDPLTAGRIDFGGTLAAVVSRPCRDVGAGDAADFVLGYTAALDLVAREMGEEVEDSPSPRARSFDGFCPLGPVLATADEFATGDPGMVRVLRNGESQGEMPVGRLMARLPDILAYLSEGTTILPGTVILLGPAGPFLRDLEGQPFLRPGDEISVEVGNVGVLMNRIVSSEEATSDG